MYQITISLFVYVMLTSMSNIKTSDWCCKSRKYFLLKFLSKFAPIFGFAFATKGVSDNGKRAMIHKHLQYK